MSDDLAERPLSSRRVFQGRLIGVRVDQVELPDGRTAVREVVDHPGAAAVVPLLPDGRVVMIRQYRHAASKTLWELPAGVLAEDETPEDCARRELVEEVGYRAGRLTRLFSTYLSPGFSSEIIHLFLAEELSETTPCAEPDEHLRPVAMPLEEAVALALRGEVQNAAAICGLLAADRRRRQDSGEAGPIS